MYTPPSASTAASRDPLLGLGGVLNVSENGMPWLDKETGDLYAIRDNGNRIDRSRDGGYSFTTVKTWGNMSVREMLKLSDGHWLLWPGAVPGLTLVDANWATVATGIPAGVTSTLGYGICVDYKPAEGIVMFCDYSTAEGSGRIQRSTDNGRSFEEVFHDPTIRHWHSLQIDPFTGHWWVFSGDEQAECKVYKSEDDGDTWILVDENNLLLKAIRAVFTRDKIIWGTDEIYGPANVVVTDRDTWNPQSIAQVGGPILGNQVTANGMAVMWMRCESGSPEKDMGRVFLTDGVKVQEVFSHQRITPTGISGFTNASHVDKFNRFWVDAPELGLVGLALPYVLN